MNNFVVEIWDDECSLCTFYTVRRADVEDDEYNETDKFFLKFENGEYHEALQSLLDLIRYSMGEDHGAHDAFFSRYENEVAGLPPKRVFIDELGLKFNDFPLRLYAMKITDEIVILFNGDLKDGPTNQTSKVNLVWREACTFAGRIQQALEDGDVIIDHNRRKLLWYDGSEEIWL